MQPDLFGELKIVNQAETKDKSQLKHHEDAFLQEALDYIAGTYSGHYIGNGDLQTTDVWETLGNADSTCRDTAIKYLMRYGKKGGNNTTDLLKAIHYICLLHNFTERKRARTHVTSV